MAEYVLDGEKRLTFEAGDEKELVERVKALRVSPSLRVKGDASFGGRFDP